jgi:hypothetical protein
MRRIELYNDTRTHADTVAWCREKGLLATIILCPICGANMTEIKDKCEEGIIWSCRRMRNGTQHIKKISVREGSVFAGSRISVKKTLYVLYEWCVNTSIGKTAMELELDESTVSKLFKHFRQTAASVVNRTFTGPIGENCTVEIDECQIGRRKAHRGRVPTQIWVFGGVICESNRQQCFLRIVPKRNREMLTPLIQELVHRHARLISDDWGAYWQLRALGIDHHIVRHCDNFVDPNNNSIHTQNIENLWRCLRRFLATKGTYTRKYLQEYLDEFVFRKSVMFVFEEMVSVLSI